jgi:plasmid stabilization system protein ParE
MSRKVILHAGALRELEEARNWYEAQREGLGDTFVQSVDTCLGQICRNPELYEVVRAPHRRAMVRRFPYAVFFEPTKDTIEVYSVFHCAQDPAKWQRRLP